MVTLMPHIKSLTSARSFSDIDLRTEVAHAEAVLRLIEKRPAPSEEIPWLTYSMWYGYEYPLCLHGLTLANVLVGERHIAAEEVPGAYMAKVGLAIEQTGANDRTVPPWVGDENVHRSHRSQLIMRSPLYAITWPSTPPRMPILWPQLVEDDPRGYRLRLSSVELRRLRYGRRQLPANLRYDVHLREVVPA